MSIFSQERKGIALIVGVSDINEEYYLNLGKSYNSDAVLGVANDLDEVEKILEDGGFEIVKILNPNPQSILSEMREIANKLDSGDYFTFYFSGHGDQVEDLNGDEYSGLDQVLVANSGFLLDDHIYDVLNSHFSKQTIIMMIDACHSGTSYKMMDFQLRENFIGRLSLLHKFKNERKLDSFSFSEEECQMPTIQTKESINMIYMGATSDESIAIGFTDGGAMTLALKSIYRRARITNSWKRYDYKRLACEIASKLEDQNFQLHLLGRNIENSIKNIPFKL